MVRAYILTKVISGMENSIFESLKKSGEAHLLFGEYDILVILNAKDMNGIDEKVSEIRNTEGVETTCTCVDRCCL